MLSNKYLQKASCVQSPRIVIILFDTDIQKEGSWVQEIKDKHLILLVWK